MVIQTKDQIREMMKDTYEEISWYEYHCDEIGNCKFIYSIDDCDDDLYFKPKEPKFKVGDKVKFISTNSHVASYFKDSLENLKIKYELSSANQYGVEQANGEDWWYVDEDKIELMPEVVYPIRREMLNGYLHIYSDGHINYYNGSGVKGHQCRPHRLEKALEVIKKAIEVRDRV